MKIAIWDDDKQELLQLRQFVDEFLSRDFTEGKIEVHSFESSLELIKQLERGKYFDVFLLDVIMPGITGIELASDIRSKDKVGKIIFLTSSPEFAVDSYSVDTFNYLLKPVQKEKLFSVLEKAISNIYNGMKKYIIVKTQIGMFKILCTNLYMLKLSEELYFFIKKTVL